MSWLGAEYDLLLWKSALRTTRERLREWVAQELLTVVAGALIAEYFSPGWTVLLGVLASFGAWVLLLLTVNAARAPYQLWKRDQERLAAKEAQANLVAPFYDEGDGTCREDWTNPSNDDPLKSVRFRLGIVNMTGSRIDGVRAVCGATVPLMTPSLRGTPFYTFPDEENEFSIPVSSDPHKPALYLNVAFCEIILSNDSEGHKTDDVWTQYIIGPADLGKRFIAYGKHVSSVPRFGFVLHLECPMRTVEIPCLIWLENLSCRFALSDDAVKPALSSAEKPVASLNCQMR